MTYFDAYSRLAFARLCLSPLATRRREELCQMFLAQQRVLDPGERRSSPAFEEDETAFDLVRDWARGLIPGRPHAHLADSAHLVRLRRIQDQLGLSDLDTALVEHMALRSACGVVGALWSLIADRFPLSAYDPHSLPDMELLGVLLEHHPRDLQNSLTTHGALAAHGLIMVDEDGECHVVRRVALWLRQSASAEYDEIGDMADFMLGASRTSALCWDDFSDYIEHAGLARELLRGAAGERTMGINILIHGDPGTGKTEFVKVLAAEVGLSLFAAAEPEPGGSPKSTHERQAALRLALSLLQSGNNAILLDEADALVEAADKWGGTRIDIHHVLEHNRVPIIWVMNDASCVPPSVLRRMSLVLRFDPPPVAVRERIWRGVLDRHAHAASAAQVRRLAESEVYTPGISEMLARTIRLAGATVDDLPRAAEGLIDLLGGCEVAGPPAGTAEAAFDPAWIHCRSQDWRAFQNLRWSPDMAGFSVLIWGEPGTGKSAYAVDLARRLGLRSRSVAASDLLGPYVGETEARIAQCFARAARSGEMIILDEIDSFLIRRHADSRSWERSMVNEFLVRMDRHRLPVVCTTNAFDQIDPAARRRFTFRLDFEPMTAAQAVRAIPHHFGVTLPATADLAGLVIADLIAVRSRRRLLGTYADTVDADSLHHALMEERGARGGAARTIGFVGPGVRVEAHPAALGRR